MGGKGGKFEMGGMGGISTGKIGMGGISGILDMYVIKGLNGTTKILITRKVQQSYNEKVICMLIANLADISTLSIKFSTNIGL